MRHCCLHTLAKAFTKDFHFPPLRGSGSFIPCCVKWQSLAVEMHGLVRQMCEGDELRPLVGGKVKGNNSYELKSGDRAGQPTPPCNY